MKIFALIGIVVSTFSLDRWSAQISKPGVFDTISSDELKNLNDKYIDTRNGYMTLTSFAGGKTSPNSKTARTELREVNYDGSRAYWDSNTYSEMYIKLSIDKLPNIKKSVMFSQLKFKSHGAAFMAFLRDKEIYVSSNMNEKRQRFTIDENYNLGDIIEILFVISYNSLSIYYKDLCEAVVSYPVNFDEAYFKAGNYMQSPSPPEPSDSKSIVTIYDLILVR